MWRPAGCAALTWRTCAAPMERYAEAFEEVLTSPVDPLPNLSDPTN